MGHPDYIRRQVHESVADALTDTRVVLIEGPRQAGKSTLAQRVSREANPETTELTLDNEATLAAAKADPTGFVGGLPRRVMIHEIQRAPELVLAIKEAVDRDPEPGRFLLTGSASLRNLRRVRDLLPGRMETIRLWPFSQAELAGSRRNVVERLMAGEPPSVRGAPIGRDAFVSLVAAGGYPAARIRTPARRLPWFRDYVDGVLSADIDDIASPRHRSELPRLLRVLASQTANIVDYNKIARDLTLDDKTTKAYTALIEQLFLIRTIKAWRPGIGKREIHRPKVYVTDSGLLAFLLEANAERIALDDQVTGRALETFCGMELLKHVDACADRPTLYHYRDGRDEIDVVIESRGGDLVCAEVKASATVTSGDYRVMSKLRDVRGTQFKAGIVLYTGAATIPLGDRIWAVPISGLWGLALSGRTSQPAAGDPRRVPPSAQRQDKPARRRRSQTRPA